MKFYLLGYIVPCSFFAAEAKVFAIKFDKIALRAREMI